VTGVQTCALPIYENMGALDVIDGLTPDVLARINAIF
jgi:hypothetical protein